MACLESGYAAGKKEIAGKKKSPLQSRGDIFRVCAEINSQIFVSRRMPDKARKHRNMDIFRDSATKSGVMHSSPKCEVIYAWALSQTRALPDIVSC